MKGLTSEFVTLIIRIFSEALSIGGKLRMVRILDDESDRLKQEIMDLAVDEKELNAGQAGPQSEVITSEQA